MILALSNHLNTGKSLLFKALNRFSAYRLFHEEYYQKNNYDIPANTPPLQHYLKQGSQEGRCPHPLFDPVYYRMKYMGNSQEEPLAHYMKQTGKLVNPHILFDAKYYSQQLKTPVKKTTLLEHFLNEGWKQGISPSPYFDFNYYYENGQDVKAAGVNPFVHYLIHGESEGRKPSKDFNPGNFNRPPKPNNWSATAYNGRNKLAFHIALEESDLDFISQAQFKGSQEQKVKKHSAIEGFESIFNELFSADYYLSTNPDIRSAGLDPFEHYLDNGSKEGRCPHPLFDPAYYREEYMEKDDSSEPLIHYLKQDNDQLHNPHPLFNATYYTKQLDSPVNNQSLLEHFLETGWKKDISPTEYFDFDFYYEQNPEIKKAGFINPLLHYIVTGEKEGRAPNSSFLPSMIEKPFMDVNWNNPVYLNQSKLSMAVTGQLSSSIQIVRFQQKLDEMDKNKPFVVFVSHEATRTGAPFIILRIAEQFAEYLDVNAICLLGYGGPISKDFEAAGPTYRFERWHPYAQEGLPEEIGMVLNLIAKYNPVGAIVNSAETRNLLPHFKYRKIPTVALIHEMGFVYPDDTFKVIADSADLTVFPSQMVDKMANKNYPFPPGKTLVKGQGLLKPEILKLDREEYHKKLREELDIPQDAFVVMGCGSLTRRKGPEFFVHTAIQVLGRTKADDIYFMWLGGKHPKIQENFYWLERDLIIADIEDKLFFMGTLPDSAPYFAGSDAFFMTSRADPFPCVIHEAMAAELPILGFEGAGGFSEALEGGCGLLVPYADTHEAANTIIDWYENPDKRKKMGSNAKQRVITDYKYLDYTIAIGELLENIAKFNLSNKEEALFSAYQERIRLQKEERFGPIAEKKEQKTVIFTVPSWELSGVNTFIEKCIQHLIAAGYNAYLLFTTNHILHFKTKPDLLPKVPYKFLGAESSNFKEIWNKLQIYLKAEAPCIFVPNYDYIASAVSANLPDDVGILGVLHSDDLEHYEHAYRLGRYWNNIVSVSQVIERKLLDYNPLFRPKSSVIYYGIDAPDERPYPQKRERFSIVYTGRIVQVQKRILDFIPIIEQLDKSGIDFVFTFIGDGPEMEELQEGLEEYMVENKVRLLGRQPMEKVFDELSKAHVFALASDFEGLPLSVLEALSYYCVPVLTDIESGISEVIKHGENGLIAPIGDAEAFVANLQKLSKDRTLCKKMSQAAFDTLKKHKLRTQDMGNQYITVFDKMFNDIKTENYKRPKPLTHNSTTENILLPPMLQKLPTGYAEDGSLY